jgi:hypothetical protein
VRPEARSQRPAASAAIRPANVTRLLQQGKPTTRSHAAQGACTTGATPLFGRGNRAPLEARRRAGSRPVRPRTGASGSPRSPHSGAALAQRAPRACAAVEHAPIRVALTLTIAAGG